MALYRFWGSPSESEVSRSSVLLQWDKFIPCEKLDFFGSFTTFLPEILETVALKASSCFLLAFICASVAALSFSHSFHSPWPIFRLAVSLNEVFEALAVATRPPSVQIKTLATAYWSVYQPHRAANW